MGSWVGPWVPFSKLSRQKAIETCEILIEQRDRQIRRAEAAEARLAEVEAEHARCEMIIRTMNRNHNRLTARLAAVEADAVESIAMFRRCRDQRDKYRARLAEVEAERDAVRRALDDELANLADDGARSSHAVVRRIEAIVRGEGDRG